MRVLHLTRDFPPSNSGGISTAVGGLVQALALRSIESRVVSFDAWRPLRSGDNTPPPQREGGVLRVTSPAHQDDIIAFGREFRPDVIHVHDGLVWPFADLIGGARTVFTMHVAHHLLRELRNLDAPTHSETAQERAISAADVVTVPCAALLPTLARPGRVVGFGVHAPTIADQTEPRNGVLFAARLADIKGVNELFSAMEIVCAERSDARLRIAGGLIANRKAERRRRRRFDEDATQTLKDATTWLGWLDRAALAREYRHAAILVAPSWHETYGLTVLEAMAHGVAVVATDVHGHAALIAHGHTGALVPVRDTSALARKIADLLKCPAVAMRLGDAASAHVREHRQWSHLVDAWIDTYR